MVRIIINADDFGISDGVCTGIVQAIRSGCLTATSAMVCVPGATDRIDRWSEMIPGCIGAHLQLTGGRPILPASDIPSLVQANGLFPVSRREVRAPKRAEVIAEWEAQIEVLVRLGIRPTHIDSHHHVHRLPEVRDAYYEIVSQHGVPARSVDPEMTERLRGMGVPCAGKTLLGWFGGVLTVASLLAVIREGVQGFAHGCVVEVMSHPGFVDDELRRVSRYVEERETELAVLCDPWLRELLQAESLSLCSFGILAPKLRRQ
jgi:predicted glycoside hydrolase/deacetylase ChbG (UPF0249 family)